jgi:hypothetical protein
METITARVTGEKMVERKGAKGPFKVAIYTLEDGREVSTPTFLKDRVLKVGSTYALDIQTQQGKAGPYTTIEGAREQGPVVGSVAHQPDDLAIRIAAVTAAAHLCAGREDGAGYWEWVEDIAKHLRGFS